MESDPQPMILGSDRTALWLSSAVRAPISRMRKVDASISRSGERKDDESMTRPGESGLKKEGNTPRDPGKAKRHPKLADIGRLSDRITFTEPVHRASSVTLRPNESITAAR